MTKKINKKTKAAKNNKKTKTAKKTLLERYFSKVHEIMEKCDKE